MFFSYFPFPAPCKLQCQGNKSPFVYHSVHHPSNILLRRTSAHSNSVLTSPHNMYRHICQSLSNVKHFEQCKQCIKRCATSISDGIFLLSNCKTTIQYLCCSNSGERLSVCQMSHFILKCINRCSALLVSDMQMSCIYFANKELFIYGVITFGGYLDPPPSPLSSRHSIHRVAEYHLFSSDALSMYRFDMTLEMY